MHHHNLFLKQRWRGASLSLLVMSALLLAVIPVASQEQKETRSSPAQDDVIKVTSNLVSLDVIVKDKKGKAVTDLKPEDFTISENGVPQKLEFFDSTLTPGSEARQTTTTPTAPVSSLPRTQTPAGFPRNIIAMVLDGQSTEGANLKHVREGMSKYIRERVSDDDSVALFAIAGGLQLLQPFTQDKAKLLAGVTNAQNVSTVSKTSEARQLSENISSLRDQISAGPSGPIENSPSAAAAGSAMISVMFAKRMLENFVQMRSVLSTQQTRPVLAALAAICEGLRPIPGKKTLVMFSEGFVASEALDWQVQSTIDIANRANVAIYIIDSSGLTGGAPKSGAIAPSSALAGISAEVDIEQRRRSGAGESVFDISRYEGLNRQQDLLYRISEDTGGHFVKNTNDIAAGLDRIDAEIRSRYTLAYRSTDPNFDGSFRKVKIQVNRPGVNVLTRPGYYAIPPSQIVPFSPEEKKLLASFANTLGRPTLPLSLSLNPFPSREGSYVVPLSLEIPPEAVQFERKNDKQFLQLEVLGVVRAEGEEKVLSRLGGYFNVSLTAQQYQSILNDKIFYRQDMQLPAGDYTIDVIVKDRVSGKMAAKREKLVLPLNKSDFWITETVLSRHAEPLRQPTGSADVLTAGNVQVRPSTSREFQSADNLIIFFKVYNARPDAETGKPLIRVAVTLLKDGKPAIKPLDYLLTEMENEPVPHLTFAKYVKLAGLAKGKYSAVIEVWDLTQKKSVKQEASFTITQ
jgi:VWFA-related protein